MPLLLLGSLHHEDVVVAEREDEPGGGDGWDGAMTDLKDCAV